MTAAAELRALDARAKLVFLAVFMVACLHARSAASLGVCLAVSVALVVAVRLRPGEVRAVALPLAPILVFTAALQVLTLQEGAVLVRIGGLGITAGAISESVRMVACLLALMLASVSFMRCTSVEDLVSVLRWLLSPLRRVGVHVDAFILSLLVAVGFLPVLVGDFQRLKTAQQARLARFDGNARNRLQSYARLFAPLLRGGFQHADNLADAFLSRGFSCCAAPTQLHEAHLGSSGAACLLAAAVLICLVIALG